MKYVIFCFLAAFSLPVFAQESFGLLKFAPPSIWQQQSRSDYVSYIPPTAGDGINEIVVYKEMPGAPRIDSSFRTEWRRIMHTEDGKPIPNAKKRTTYSGIPYAENGAEVLVDGAKKYMQLLVFAVGNQVQSVTLMTNDLQSYRRSQEEIFNFMDSVDTIQKRKD